MNIHRQNLYHWLAKGKKSGDLDSKDMAELDVTRFDMQNYLNAV